ncbi:MAG: sulfatase-like hydrolase/transferase, partial [Planctomycetaceae bacterium]
MSKQMNTDTGMAEPLRSTARFRKNGQLTLLATRASGVRLAMRIVAFGIALLIGSEIMCRVTHAAEAAAPPNIVIVFLDDSGWGDFRPFGQPKYDTPHVRKLAEEGRVFKNFYVPQGICSASRSALLSGCYPGRTKIFGAHAPRARGLDPRFATMGEVLKRQGYATAVFGKWHIGDRPETRPPARGFSESCGLMYSNDMWEFHPEKPKFWGKYPLQFWDNGKVTIERVTP